MGHLHIEGRKMSKSLKNFISIRDYLSYNWTSSPAVDLRIYFLQHKYHSTLHFSKERIVEASILRRKFETFSFYINNVRNSTTERASIDSPASISLRKQLYTSKVNIRKALEDDFNTPHVMNILSDLVGSNLQLAVTATTDLTIQIDALISVESYIVDILGMLGINITNQQVNNRSKVSYFQSSNKFYVLTMVLLKISSVNSIDRLISSYVNFRSNIRDTIVSELKNKSSNQAHNDRSIEVFKRQLQFCDFARDDLLTNSNVNIMDNKLPVQASTTATRSSNNLQSASVMWSYVSAVETPMNNRKNGKS